MQTIEHPKDAKAITHLRDSKYIVVLGSLMSGLGKGIVTASVARLLNDQGLKVTAIKFDGYLNIDCGTMNPYRHGEVFVLDDGTECDMDFGTYERFLNQGMSGTNSITGGKLFKLIIEKERTGKFLGRDVQFIPHLTDEIKSWVKGVGAGKDVVLVEVGGTVGDLENGYFIEAMRQLSSETREVTFIQLTYVPMISTGEYKTKPTQHATRLLQSMGVQPQIILVRADGCLPKDSKEKISQFCNIPLEAVYDDPDIESIYELPLMLEKQDFTAYLMKLMGMKKDGLNLVQWKSLVEKIKNPRHAVKIGIVGKYTKLHDAYVSIREAFIHAGAALDTKVEIEWIESEGFENDPESVSVLKDYDGILVPGGFGSRGIEGKINAIKYVRENKIPYFGICLGMQMMVVEYARNVCGLKGANSTEFDENTKSPVIDLLPEQRAIKDKGATMRLGAWKCELAKGTRAFEAYGKQSIEERHRHRYEVNNDYLETLEKSGIVLSSRSGHIVEMVEWKEPHGFGIGLQAHPEYKSRLEEPAPLFVAFVKAALERKKK